MPPDDSATLLARLGREDDRLAWSALISLHQRLVFGCCWRLLRDVSAAEDAAQEAFLAVRAHALGFRPRGDGEADARAWIARVACTCALKHARGETRRRERERKAVEPPPRPAGESELMDRLRAELAALPGRERAALELHYLAGLDYPEVAAALGTSAGAARVRVHRALGALRSRLAGAGVAIATGTLASALAAEPPALPADFAAQVGTPLTAPAAASAAVPPGWSLSRAALSGFAATALAVGVAVQAAYGAASFSPGDPRPSGPGSDEPAPAPAPPGRADDAERVARALRRPVKIEFPDADLREVAAVLSELTSIEFALDAALLAKKDIPKVSLSWKQAAVPEVLDVIDQMCVVRHRIEGCRVLFSQGPEPVYKKPIGDQGPAIDCILDLEKGAEACMRGIAEKAGKRIVIEHPERLADFAYCRRFGEALDGPLRFTHAPVGTVLDWLCAFGGATWAFDADGVLRVRPIAADAKTWWTQGERGLAVEEPPRRGFSGRVIHLSDGHIIPCPLSLTPAPDGSVCGHLPVSPAAEAASPAAGGAAPQP